MNGWEILKGSLGFVLVSRAMSKHIERFDVSFEETDKEYHGKNYSFIGAFTVKNLTAKFAGFPREDSFAYDEEKEVMCVADGITRDFSDGSVVRKSLFSLIKVRTRKYPNHAQKVADICTKTFITEKSLARANKKIEGYNCETFDSINYLENDFAGCTAAGVFEEGNLLNGEFVGDSGIAVINEDGELKFKTNDEGPNSRGSINDDVRKKYNTGFNEQKGRRIIRSEYRNNLEEPLAYGALTGEENALAYIRKGNLKINSGECILIFTDGIRELLFPRDENGKEKMILNEEYADRIIDWDINGLEKLCRRNIKTEGTLVVWKKL